MSSSRLRMFTTIAWITPAKKTKKWSVFLLGIHRAFRWQGYTSYLWSVPTERSLSLYILCVRFRVQVQKPWYYFKAKKGLWFLVSACVASHPHVSSLRLLLFYLCRPLFVFSFCYETMSNYSQNCWVDWNSTCCVSTIYFIGVWTFARFLRPLSATILCVWTI